MPKLNTLYDSWGRAEASLWWGQEKFYFCPLHPEGYTGYTADTRVFYFILLTKSIQLGYKHLATAETAAYKKLHSSPNLCSLHLFCKLTDLQCLKKGKQIFFF